MESAPQWLMVLSLLCVLRELNFVLLLLVFGRGLLHALCRELRCDSFADEFLRPASFFGLTTKLY